MAETLREALTAIRLALMQDVEPEAIIDICDEALARSESPSPEGLNVARLRRAMRPVKRRVSLRHPDDHADYERGFREQCEPPTPEEVAAEYLRLAENADG